MTAYATFHGDNLASSHFASKELAEELCLKQNTKAEDMGIQAQYTVKTSTPGPAVKPLTALPSVWK